MSATRHDEIEREQFDKINSLTARVEGLASAVDVSNDILVKQMNQNAADHSAAMDKMQKMHDSYVKMTKYIIGLLFVVIFSLIGALIYGAIGKEGLHAVRETMPNVVQAVPWHNDMDKFFRRKLAA